MSFFFEQLARTSGIGLPVRALEVPAPSPIDVVQEVEAVPAAERPSRAAGVPIAAVPATERRIEHTSVEQHRETVVERVRERAVDRLPRETEHVAVPAPAPPPAVSVVHSREQILERVLQWVARTPEGPSPRAPEPPPRVANTPAVVAELAPGEPPPGRPERVESVGEMPREPVVKTVQAEPARAPASDSRSVQGEPIEPIRSHAVEENVEVHVGSIQVIVEAPNDFTAGARAPAPPAPARRSTAVAAPPSNSIRRYGLLPD